MGNTVPSEEHTVVFNNRNIRRTLHEGKWWFSVIDIVKALTDSADARDYWHKMKVRVRNADGAELSTFCRQLKLESSDGKGYRADCANTGCTGIRVVPRYGGQAADNNRKDFEGRTGKKVITKQNYLKKT